MPNRNAAATIFGFDFQARAAIVLMLDNIKSAQSIKVEGEEDIEIHLDDGQKILAQAKAVVKIDDFSHVRENLKHALESLSESAAHVPAKELVLLTNSANPFKDNDSRPLFWGPNKISFEELPPSSKNLVETYLREIDNPLDTQKFVVQRIPFQTDDENERAKAIKKSIDDFLGTLSLNFPGMTNKLYDIWTSQLLFNGTISQKKRVLSKKKFVWPIIVIETDIKGIDDEILDAFDDAEFEEITTLYHMVIDSHCERFDFVTRVLSDYQQFHKSHPKGSLMDFAAEYQVFYEEEFDVSGIDAIARGNLTKIILYSVVKRWRVIERVRKGVNLCL